MGDYEKVGMEVIEVVCSLLAGRGREMLARGFALGFEGIRMLSETLSAIVMPACCHSDGVCY